VTVERTRGGCVGENKKKKKAYYYWIKKADAVWVVL